MPEVTHLSWENHAKKPSWFQNRWTFPVEKKLQKHPCLETTTFTYIYVMHTLVGETTSNPPPKKNALDSLIPIKSMGLVSTPYMKTHYQIMRNSCRLNIPNSSPWILRNGNLPLWVQTSRFSSSNFPCSASLVGCRRSLGGYTDSHGDEFGRFNLHEMGMIW